jgi:hypothetical protein
VSAVETQLLFARAVLLVLLYAFVGAIGAVAWFELRLAGRRDGTTPSPAPSTRLIVLDGGQSGRPPGTSFTVETVTALGRDLDNQVVLVEPTISGRHAVVNQREGAWWIEDLRSTNGTYVNGTRLAPESPAILRSGDVLQLGTVRLRLVSPDL